MVVQYCLRCGGCVREQWVEVERRERPVCETCGVSLYLNREVALPRRLRRVRRERRGGGEARDPGGGGTRHRRSLAAERLFLSGVTGRDRRLPFPDRRRGTAGGGRGGRGGPPWAPGACR